MSEYLFNDQLSVFKKNIDFLINLYDKKKLPQTLLFIGEKGIGKLNVAYHLVNYILSKNDENEYYTSTYKINPNNKTYNLLLNNSHPNFFLISLKENKKNIDIEQIKYMKNFLNITSFNNKPKIILINGSESLNSSSSNSLLKSLEENLNNVFFILVHDIKKNILHTIKSRCIQFNFFLQSDDRKNRINEILDNQYNHLSSDFKNKYLSPTFFKNLLEYCNKNNLKLIDMNLDNLLYDIIEKKNYYWGSDFKLQTPWPEGQAVMNTKFVDTTYEAAHCLYAGKMSKIGNSIWMGDFMTPGDIQLYPMDEREVFDIDYEWQFQYYENLYKSGVR